MVKLSLASVEQIMRNAGAERISMDAIVATAETLEEYETKISGEGGKE